MNSVVTWLSQINRLIEMRPSWIDITNCEIIWESVNGSVFFKSTYVNYGHDCVRDFSQINWLIEMRPSWIDVK